MRLQFPNISAYPERLWDADRLIDLCGDTTEILLGGKLVLGKREAFATIVDRAPLRLLTERARVSEVSPLSERAHEEQMPAETQGQVAKEWTEWVDQCERETRFPWSGAHDHAASVSVAHPASGCEHHTNEALRRTLP